MEPLKLIVDNFRESRSRIGMNTARFRSGAYLKVLKTSNNESIDNVDTNIQSMLCCSSVRNVSANWFYLLEDVKNLDFIKTWLNEVSTEFPHFKIEVMEVEKDQYIKNGLSRFNSFGSCTYMKTYLNIDYILEHGNKYPNVLGVYLTDKLKSEGKKTKYSISIQDVLFEMFIDYCVKEDKHPIRETIITITDEFVDNNHDAIIKYLKEYTDSYNSFYVTSKITAFHYKATLKNILDFDRFDFEELKIFYRDAFQDKAYNYNLIALTNILYYRSKNYKAYVIRALYQNRKSRVEPYLAHHLIRAILTEEFIPYIKQYFAIKEKNPDMYFWNIIFLCQFGFRIYYYYWLTDKRLFSFITKKDFANRILEYKGDSSFDFFSPFYKTLPKPFMKALQLMYESYDFENFYKNLVIDSYVRPTEKFLKRSSNFNFKQKYKVLFETASQYIITGDDYRNKRYLKKNFIKIENENN